MYKTVEDLMCVPLIVTAEELLPLITNTQHLRDFERISMFDRGYITCLGTTSFNFYYVLDKESSALDRHLYNLDLEKTMALYNSKLNNNKSLQSFIQRRTSAV